MMRPLIVLWCQRNTIRKCVQILARDLNRQLGLSQDSSELVQVQFVSDVQQLLLKIKEGNDPIDMVVLPCGTMIWMGEARAITKLTTVVLAACEHGHACPVPGPVNPEKTEETNEADASEPLSIPPHILRRRSVLLEKLERLKSRRHLLRNERD